MKEKEKKHIQLKKWLKVSFFILAVPGLFFMCQHTYLNGFHKSHDIKNVGIVYFHAIANCYFLMTTSYIIQKLGSIEKDKNEDKVYLLSISINYLLVSIVFMFIDEITGKGIFADRNTIEGLNKEVFWTMMTGFILGALGYFMLLSTETNRSEEDKIKQINIEKPVDFNKKEENIFYKNTKYEKRMKAIQTDFKEIMNKQGLLNEEMSYHLEKAKEEIENAYFIYMGMKNKALAENEIEIMIERMEKLIQESFDQIDKISLQSLKKVNLKYESVE